MFWCQAHQTSGKRNTESFQEFEERWAVPVPQSQACSGGLTGQCGWGRATGPQRMFQALSGGPISQTGD